MRCRCWRWACGVNNMLLFFKASSHAVRQTAGIAPLGPPYTNKYTISAHAPTHTAPSTAIHRYEHADLHRFLEDRFRIKSPAETCGSPALLVLFLLQETRLRGRRELQPNLIVTGDGETEIEEGSHERQRNRWCKLVRTEYMFPLFCRSVSTCYPFPWFHYVCVCVWVRGSQWMEVIHSGQSVTSSGEPLCWCGQILPLRSCIEGDPFSCVTPSV